MSGPFFFAWVDPTDTTFSPAFKREDEDIVSFNVTQSEGDFAQLELVVRNPKVGLLKAGRKVWAWLAYNPDWRPDVPRQLGQESVSDELLGSDGSFLESAGSFVFETDSSSEVDLGNVRPLFFGRLVGIPTDINQELVTLVFSARPADFAEQKATVAESLKVRPFYDPIFIDQQQLTNPDTVLEGYPALWAIDRVTGVVSVSDVLNGEDGTEAFAEADVPYDSVQISLNQTPLVSVTVDGQVNWTQTATGAVAGFGDRVTDTYTGKSLMNNWPKLGASLGGGWVVRESSAVDAYECENVKIFSSNWSWENKEKSHVNGDTMSSQQSISVPQIVGPYLSQDMTGDFVTGVVDPFSDPPVNRGSSFNVSTLYVAQSKITTHLGLGYDAKRGRTEHVKFTLTADVQPLVTLPEDTDTLLLTLNSADVSLPLATDGGSASDGVIPIVDPSRGQFFTSDRGQLALEYLISVARAHLMIRARAVQVTWTCSFDRAINFTLRKNASILDDRLPGGGATGKIVSYGFSGDASSGAILGTVTIGCAIGRDGNVTASNGTPDYVEEGYVTVGYQTYSNQVAVFSDGSVGYTVPTTPPNDDGITFPLSKSKAGTEIWHNTDLDTQEELIRASFSDDRTVADLSRDTAPSVRTQMLLAQAQTGTTETILKSENVATWYELRLNPLDGGPFNTDYDVITTVLKIPRMINLEV